MDAKQINRSRTRPSTARMSCSTSAFRGVPDICPSEFLKVQKVCCVAGRRGAHTIICVVGPAARLAAAAAGTGRIMRRTSTSACVWGTPAQCHAISVGTPGAPRHRRARRLLDGVEFQAIDATLSRLQLFPHSVSARSTMKMMTTTSSTTRSLLYLVGPDGKFLDFFTQATPAGAIAAKIREHRPRKLCSARA